MATSKTLSALLNDAKSDRILLPNFQREYVWDDAAQAALATSVFLQVPIGAVLLISGGPTAYQSRRIGIAANATNIGLSEDVIIQFLLDGQQRLSTLAGVFDNAFGEDWVSQFKNTYKGLKVRWSLKLRPTDNGPDLFNHRLLRFHPLELEPDLFAEALVANRIWMGNQREWYHPARSDSAQPGLSSLANAIAADAAALGEVPLWETVSIGRAGPMSAVAEQSALRKAIDLIADERCRALKSAIEDGEAAELIKDLADCEGIAPDDVGALISAVSKRRERWASAVFNIIVGVSGYKIDCIELEEAEAQKAIVIFEAINRGGRPLQAFELVAARYARASSDTSLPEEIRSRIEKRGQGREDNWSRPDGVLLSGNSLTPQFRTQFLQVLSCARILRDGKPCSVEHLKQTQFLSLKSNEVRDGWMDATDALLDTWAFLQMRCFVTSEGTLRNKMLVLPIALARAALNRAFTAEETNKVEFWYWTSTLAGRYTQRQNEQCVHDVNALLNWLNGGAGDDIKSRQNSVLADAGYSNLDSLLPTADSPSTAATDVGLYLLQFVAAVGGTDIFGGDLAYNHEVEDHHIIPLGSVAALGVKTRDIRDGKVPELAFLNSPLNRAYVRKDTNRKISDTPYETYVQHVHPSSGAGAFIPQDFVRGPNERTREWAREVMKTRHEAIRTAALNHMTRLLRRA